MKYNGKTVSHGTDRMKNIFNILTADTIIDISSETKDSALGEMIDTASKSPHVKSRADLQASIRYRESIMSTGVGLGIAIPHAKISSVTDFVIVLGRSSSGIEYDSLDGDPVYLILLIAASDTQGDEFLKLLGRIGTIFNVPQHIQKILSAKSPESILGLLKKIEKS